MWYQAECACGWLLPSKEIIKRELVIQCPKCCAMIAYVTEAESIELNEIHERRLKGY